MLVELDNVLEIINSRCGDDIYWWDNMIEEIKELGNPSPKILSDKPRLFNDDHCIDVYQFENHEWVKIGTLAEIKQKGDRKV